MPAGRGGIAVAVVDAAGVPVNAFSVGLGDPATTCCYGGQPTGPGLYRNSNAVPGPWVVSIRAPGSLDVTLNLLVHAGSWTTATAVLQPDTRPTPYHVVLEVSAEDVPGPPIKVEQAETLPDGAPAKVGGLVIRAGPDAPTYLCSTYQMSFPPACGIAASLVVVGIEIDTIPGVQTRDELSWVEGAVLSGRVRRP